MMDESKGQHIGKAPSLHLFHSTVRQCMGFVSILNGGVFTTD